MRIFVNALSARLGGGQTYLLNLLKHIPKDLQVYILTQPTFHLDALPNNVVKIEQSSLVNPLLRAVWEEVCIPSILKKLKIDLFFSPGGLLPKSLPRGMLTAVTFQNMLPFDHLQRVKYSYGYRRFRDWMLKRGLSSSMRQADLVIFLSKFAREFIRQDLGELAGRSALIPHGIHPSFRANGIPLSRPDWAPNSDYFLYVSWIDHYKAQLELVRGFNLYYQQGGKGVLLFVGAEYTPYADIVRKEIVNLGLSESVRFIGNVPHGELPAAYQNAKINIFGSFTENCPNILLEMMVSGRPALVSNFGPMPEFGKNVVEYFNAASPVSFAMQLSKLMGDHARQNHLGNAAMQEAEKYTWEQTAQLTWNAIRNTKKDRYDCKWQI